MFWTVNAPDNSGSLYEVDTTTRRSDTRVQLPELRAGGGPHGTGTGCQDDAPDEAGNLQAIFENGSQRNGDFRLPPSTTYSGETGSGL